MQISTHNVVTPQNVFKRIMLDEDRGLWILDHLWDRSRIFCGKIRNQNPEMWNKKYEVEEVLLVSSKEQDSVIRTEQQ